MLFDKLFFFFFVHTKMYTKFLSVFIFYNVLLYLLHTYIHTTILIH